MVMKPTTSMIMINMLNSSIVSNTVTILDSRSNVCSLYELAIIAVKSIFLLPCIIATLAIDYYPY